MLSLLVIAGFVMNNSTSPFGPISANDIKWQSPSADSAGSMPIGNGEVVLNVWDEAASGDIVFLIGRSDSLSEISRVLKLGQVRVHLEPNPFLQAPDFSQQLHLRDGRITFSGKGEEISLFVDSAAHVIHITGTATEPVKVTATLEDWRTLERELPQDEMNSAWSVHNAPFPLTEAPDKCLTDDPNAVTWYHRNESSVVPELWKNQDLVGLNGTFDPLIRRTCGGRMTGAGFKRSGDHIVESAQLVKSFDLSVATYVAQTPDVQAWEKGVRAVATSSPLGKAQRRTENWWHDFWERSWVFVSGDGADEITRGYVLQRYVQACQGRGVYPIKFNGGTYTVEPKPMGKSFNADYRAWGDSQWWQNVRHMYHPMLESGDWEMMEPLFQLYEKCRPLAESRAKHYHGAEGAYFPETMTDYGTYSGGDYGWDRTGHQPKDVLCPWWQYAWNQGLELTALMLDRWDYTGDEAFLKKRALPMAESVLKYFDTRFKKDADGRIILDPTQSVETLWYGVVNDMPSTAGLIAVTQRLTTLSPVLLTAEQKAFFTHMRGACPQLPIEVKNGAAVLAPAQQYKPERSNCENPELYAVWPFRVVSIGSPELMAQAREAYRVRVNHLDVGWGYDGNVAAVLGMADEAARILKVKCANSHKGYRWPATWGPNFDWLPDQNHGGNLLNTANLMLLQGDSLAAGGKIYLLPAWPLGWDVSFKLHAPGNTTVTCVARGRIIEKLEVSPAARAKDVVWPKEWGLAEKGHLVRAPMASSKS